MDLYIKSANDTSEIEFHRINEGELFIGIETGHGGFHYILTEDEVKALVDYIKLTDEK